MVTTRVVIAAAAFAVVLGATGCGSEPASPAPQGRVPSAQPVSARSGFCPRAPRRLAAAVRHGITRGGRPRRLFAIRSRASFSDRTPEVRAGVYFASGDIGPAVATWAANTRAWRTGAGLIVAVDEEARAVSPPRWQMSRRRLAHRFGISRRTDGYARARACANPTRASRGA